MTTTKSAQISHKIFIRYSAPLSCCCCCSRAWSMQLPMAPWLKKKKNTPTSWNSILITIFYLSLSPFSPLKSILLTNFFRNLYMAMCVCNVLYIHIYVCILLCTFVYIFLINRAQTQTLNNIFSGFHFECPAVCWAAKQLQIVFIYGTQLFLWTAWIYLLDVAPRIYPVSTVPPRSITAHHIRRRRIFNFSLANWKSSNAHTPRFGYGHGNVGRGPYPEMATTTWPDSETQTLQQDQNHRHMSAKAADKCDEVGSCSTAIKLTHAQWSQSDLFGGSIQLKWFQ